MSWRLLRLAPRLRASDRGSLRRVAAGLLLWVGCGRLDFTPVAPFDGNRAVDSAPIPDGPVGAWSIVQSAGGVGPATTIAPSHAGNLLVVGIETDNLNFTTSVVDDAGNSYVDLRGSHAVSITATDGLQLWYAKNSIAGATLVTATATQIKALVVWEIAGIRTDAPFDTASHLDNQAASTTVLGAAITTTVAGDLVIETTVVVNSAVGIANGFTNDQSANTNGWAHLTAVGAPAGTYIAQWDQDSAGAYCSSSAAFEVGP